MSESTATKKDILRILQNLNDLDALKDLVWERLNYDHQNKPLTRKGWPDSAKDTLAEDPILWATAGDNDDFHVIYIRLQSDKLLFGSERTVIERLLREHPYALFIVSNNSHTHWHFINVKSASTEHTQQDR